LEVISYNCAGADINDKLGLHDKTGFELGAVPHLRTRVDRGLAAFNSDIKQADF
jgi:hypothetical protein